MTRINKGETFPQFTFSTHLRDDLTPADVLKGKTVFWVLRYIGCTICRLDVRNIALNYDAFKAAGAQVFVLMQSDREHVLNDLKATNAELPFEIICDPEEKIYHLLSIDPAKDKEELRGNVMDKLQEKVGRAREAGFVHGDYEGNELQLPALFIVDEDGTVLYAHYGENIVDNPTVDEVLAMLKEMNA